MKDKKPEDQAKRLKAYMVQVIKIPTLDEAQKIEKMCEFVDKVILDEK